jgi:hypothetical protein
VAERVEGAGVSDGPDFLVIGAQKCGTTTLYEDLRAHPGVALLEKESSLLNLPDAATDAGARRYREVFQALPSGRVTGEVTTRYAMRPLHDSASVADAVLAGIKVIYIVRDPVARAISHHHHLMHARSLRGSFDEMLLDYPEIVDNSCYASQLRPWIRAFGRDNVLVIRFEDYVTDRGAGVTEVFEFLGLPHHAPRDPDHAHNRASDRRVAKGGWARFRATAAYRRVLRPMLPEAARRRLTRVVLPPAVETRGWPSPETLARMLAQLEPEVTQLAQILDTELWWDLRKYVVAPDGRQGDG